MARRSQNETCARSALSSPDPGQDRALAPNAEDVTDTLELALTVSGCDQAHVQHKPRLLSDNGSSYISGDLAEWLDDRRMKHVRGAPYHPQTQGKIERWHQTLKNRILLENYFLPGDLEGQIEAFIEHYMCSTMKAEDVTDTLELALTASGCDQAHVQHKPRLLSDNGSSYISGDLAEWLDDRRMKHVRGAPYHPQTQGKIERWHQTLKNRILLENYFLPGDLEGQIEAFIEHYMCSTMKAEDVTDTLELALTASGCDQAHVQHKPRLLSDNGSSYISGDLAEWLDDRRMKHVRGAPYHPQTQGKIERWHQTLRMSPTRSNWR